MEKTARIAARPRRAQSVIQMYVSHRAVWQARRSDAAAKAETAPKRRETLQMRIIHQGAAWPCNWQD
jgi:hypothetical protein